ncbi:hypothetical protein EZV62_023393 [Acer yangbiense]|uniref:Leucine-rich repeat-containing N-terminal plant-type domain-containing protein n=1 Tax=Acer yangbiense TaxID=1000413 RepID=A0A5C7H256_9ROSI|nr:hypothetical protein EZV62_023393 [Acer yangbiense]
MAQEFVYFYFLSCVGCGLFWLFSFLVSVVSWVVSSSPLCPFVGSLVFLRLNLQLERRFLRKKAPQSHSFGSLAWNSQAPSHQNWEIYPFLLLSLYNNSFHGSLPNELANLRRLKYLNLANNNFNEEIPSWIGSFTTLQSLLLFGNSFRGSVPSSLSYLSKLETLDLYNNLLQGNIPEEIGNLPSLKTFYLDKNQLSGSIPSSIFNISSLLLIDFSDNHLSGFIPSPTLNMSLLKIIDFSTNNLSSPLPFDMFDQLPELQEIYLSCNQLLGYNTRRNQEFDYAQSIISWLKQLHRFGSNSIFYLHNIQFQNLGCKVFVDGGVVNGVSSSVLADWEQMPRKCPAWLLRDVAFPSVLLCPTISIFRKIPRQIGEVKSLEILSLIENSLAGSIPSEIGNLTQLKLLDISYNYFTV